MARLERSFRIRLSRAQGTIERLRAALPVGHVVKGRLLEDLGGGRARIEITGGRGEEKPILLTAEGLPEGIGEKPVPLRVVSHAPRLALRPALTGEEALRARLEEWGIPPAPANLRLLARLLVLRADVNPEIFRRLAAEVERTGSPPEAVAFFHARGLPRTKELLSRLARSGKGEIARAYRALEKALAARAPDEALAGGTTAEEARRILREALVSENGRPPDPARHPILHEANIRAKGEGIPAKEILLRLAADASASPASAEIGEAARTLLEAVEGRALAAPGATGFVFLRKEEDEWLETEIRFERTGSLRRLFLQADTSGAGEIRAILDAPPGKEIGASFRLEEKARELLPRFRAARGKLGSALAASGFRMGAFSVDAPPAPGAEAHSAGLDLTV